MQLKRNWLGPLGAVALGLISQVSADAQITDPNLSVIREFNIVLTDNTKVSDLLCCMGLGNEMKSDPQYRCFDHQALSMSNSPGARRVGIQYCHHLAGSTPDQAYKTFKDTCTQASGELITPDKGYCPQRWPNYADGYKKQTPAPAPAPPNADAPAPGGQSAGAPDAGGKGTNDKDGFKSTGTFHYTLVDYDITQSHACCKASSKPILGSNTDPKQPKQPKLYACAQRKVTSTTFMSHCAKALADITKAKKLSGYTTLGGDDDTIVDEKTKSQCSAMWTNAISYTYGFCQLDHDGARDDAIKAFKDDCAAKGGESKDPHMGMCLWNVDNAAADSTTA